MTARLPRLAAHGVVINTREGAVAAASGAAEAGRVEALQHVLGEVCPRLELPAAEVAAEAEVLEAALEGGSAAVCVVLQEHGVAFSLCDVRSAAGLGHVELVRWLASTPGAVRVAGAAGAGDTEAREAWCWVFSRVAEAGCDVPLLRVLHERCGAAVDLVAVAAGGSVEQLEWAAAVLRASGREPMVSPARDCGAPCRLSDPSSQAQSCFCPQAPHPACR